MPEFMKKISTLVKTVDKLLNNLQKNAGEVMTAGKEVRESLPKKDPDDKEKV